MAFCLASFTYIMFSRFIYDVPCVSTSFLFMAELYSIAWMDHILFIICLLMGIWVVSTF